MATMKEIKSRINNISDTVKITNAMYLISSTKLNSARITLMKSGLFFDESEEAAKLISVNIDSIFTKESPGKRLIVVFGAEKGLAGDYSKNLLKKYKNSAETDDELIVLGKKTAALFSADGLKINIDFNIELNKTHAVNARTLSDYLIHRFINEKISEIIFIYSRFSSKSEPVTVKKYLPIQKTSSEKNDFVFYPNTKEVGNEIIKNYLFSTLYGIILSSYCSEQNARMAAMNSAKDNAEELLNNLKVQYNHLRQNAITSEIAEISSTTLRGNT